MNDHELTELLLLVLERKVEAMSDSVISFSELDRLDTLRDKLLGMMEPETRARIITTLPSMCQGNLMTDMKSITERLNEMLAEVFQWCNVCPSCDGAGLIEAYYGIDHCEPCVGTGCNIEQLRFAS